MALTFQGSCVSKSEKWLKLQREFPCKLAQVQITVLAASKGSETLRTFWGFPELS